VYTRYLGLAAHVELLDAEGDDRGHAVHKGDQAVHARRHHAFKGAAPLYHASLHETMNKHEVSSMIGGGAIHVNNISAGRRHGGRGGFTWRWRMQTQQQQSMFGLRMDDLQ